MNQTFRVPEYVDDGPTDPPLGIDLSDAETEIEESASSGAESVFGQPARANTGAPQPRVQSPTEALGQAIDASVATMERAIAVGGLALSIVGLIVALFVSVAGNPRLGAPLIVVAGCSAAFFLAVRAMLKNSPDLAVAPFLSPVFENRARAVKEEDGVVLLSKGFHKSLLFEAARPVE